MKFVVLGSNSFTGSHFVNYLIVNTDAEIVGISRTSEYNPIFLPYLYRKKPTKRFRFYPIDINSNLSHILELIETEKPEYIVNYMAQGEVRNSWRWPDQWYETNVMSIVRLSNELVNKTYIKKYIAVSTPEVYGTIGENIYENNQYNPSTPYAVSKLAGDLHLMSLFRRYSFPVNFTRSANLFGVHQQLYRIIPKTIIRIKKGGIIELHGDGKAIRSFIHARDVADATYKICMTDKSGEVYHIAPEQKGITIYDLVRHICNKMGVSFSRHVKMSEENYGQDFLYSISSDKIRKELYWQDHVTLDQGLDETIKWIDENWNLIKNLSDEYQHKK